LGTALGGVVLSTLGTALGGVVLSTLGTTLGGVVLSVLGKALGGVVLGTAWDGFATVAWAWAEEMGYQQAPPTKRLHHICFIEHRE